MSIPLATFIIISLRGNNNADFIQKVNCLYCVMIVIMGMKVFVIIIIMTYTLTADYTEIATINSMRVMVAVALLFTVTVS